MFAYGFEELNEKDQQEIQICLSLNFLLYTKIMNISPRRLLTSITREIGGFFVCKKNFKKFWKNTLTCWRSSLQGAFSQEKKVQNQIYLNTNKDRLHDVNGLC